MVGAGVLGEAAITEAADALSSTAAAAISASASITEVADTIVSAAAAAVSGAAAIAEAADTLAATIGEVIVVEPTPAGNVGRRRWKKRSARRRLVEDQDELYQYPEPEEPEAPPADPTPPVVYIPPPPFAPPVNLPEIALSKGIEIPYFPLKPQQKVQDVTAEKSQAKPERKPVNRANLMKAIAVAMLMLEDL
jgi:hypothetical protein